MVEVLRDNVWKKHKMTGGMKKRRKERNDGKNNKKENKIED